MTLLHLYHTTRYTSVPYSTSPLHYILYPTKPYPYFSAQNITAHSTLCLSVTIHFLLICTLRSVPYHTVPLLLCSKHYKSPPLLLRTARNLILPYFTQTEQYPTQLYLDGTRQNNTPHYNTITSLCLFQLTITLQYHKLLFSTITKLLTLINNSTHFNMLYLAFTLPDRSMQCHYHSALCITSPLQHLDHTARCALSHTLPHQHSQSPYFHKPYYASNLTLNRIASQYPLRNETKHY